MAFFEGNDTEEKKEPQQTQPPVGAGTASQAMPEVPPVSNETLSVEAQISQLAEKYHKTVEDLKKDLEKIKSDTKLGDKGGLVVLKSNLNSGYGQTKEREFVARCISIDGSRELSRKDGSKFSRSGAEFIILDEEGKPNGASLGLFDADVELYKKFFWGKPYKFTAGYYLDNNTKRLILKVPVSKEMNITPIPEPTNPSLPTFQDLASKAVLPLSQAPRYVGKNGVFSGTIAKHITNRAGVYLGFEITDPTISDVVTCWLHDPLLAVTAKNLEKLPIGSDVWLYVYVNQGDDGKIRFSPSGIYPPAKKA